MTVEEDLPLQLAENTGWDERIEVIQVGSLVRSHLIYTESFTVVYDTLLGPLSGDWLARRVQERAPGKPTVVVISHSDWDHCWGSASFRAPILGLDLCAERMLGSFGQAELEKKRAEHASYAAVRPVAPTVRLRGEATLDGGDLTLHLLHTPGHRPDHLAIHIPEIRTLLPGDAVETPFALLDEAEPARDLDDMQKTLERFVALDPQWVLANHAPPQAGTTLISDNLAYYRRLVQAARESPNLRALQHAFPYPGPPDQDFYRKDHERIVKAAWKAYHA